MFLIGNKETTSPLHTLIWRPVNNFAVHFKHDVHSCTNVYQISRIMVLQHYLIQLFKSSALCLWFIHTFHIFFFFFFFALFISHQLFFGFYFTYILGTQKNGLIETFPLSTHNMFCMRDRQIKF